MKCMWCFKLERFTPDFYGLLSLCLVWLLTLFAKRERGGSVRPEVLLVTEALRCLPAGSPLPAAGHSLPSHRAHAHALCFPP